jgi:hypothetical protein
MKHAPMIKIRLMMWADNLTYMGEMINAYKVLDGNPERKDRGRGGGGGMDSSGSGQRQVAGSCNHGRHHETSSFINVAIQYT